MSDTLELTFSPPQSELLLCESRYVDAEGAIRSGKTWACSQKIADYVLRYPGIHCFIGGVPFVAGTPQQLDALTGVLG